VSNEDWCRTKTGDDSRLVSNQDWCRIMTGVEPRHGVESRLALKICLKQRARVGMSAGWGQATLNLMQIRLHGRDIL
jgi:hypothetical protein